MIGKLILEDGSVFLGNSFGNEESATGEAVFSTGMVGYPESLTDPSYCGQILIFTYPLIGNYGVGPKKYWESEKIQVSGLIVSKYNETPSHFQSERSLSDWLQEEGIPALEITDTRLLAIKLRTKGTMLGKIVFPLLAKSGNGGKLKGIAEKFFDPNKENLVDKVSAKKIVKQGRGGKTICLIDCGAKKNIERCLLKYPLRLITVPWNFNPFKQLKEKIDAIVISNGPGDPKMAKETIKTVKEACERKIPLLGICLGNQILALAGGGDTGKLKFGHRSQNQPCIMSGSRHCYITTQNHGFSVVKMPKKFKTWFLNANDGTNEGIIHKNLPIMSVQFHPEASPGPTDTEWIFTYFLKRAKII